MLNNRFIAVFVFLVLADYTSIAFADNCLALVNTNNDLWVANENGVLVKQLTTDGKLKYAASLSKDGRVIAYGGVSTKGITLIYFDGTVMAQNIDYDNVVVDLEWVDDGILKVGEHISPHANNYRFYKISTNIFTGVTEMSTPLSRGDNCAISPNGKDVSCAFGRKVALNGADIFNGPSPFDSSITLQARQAGVGDTFTLEKPPVQITVLEATNEAITLRVNLPEGTWEQHYTLNGATIELPNQEGVYGLQAIIRNDGNVTLQLKESITGAISFESGPVWDVRGRRLAFVEANGVGHRTLTVLNVEMGAATADKNAMQGAIDGQTVLPIAGPISSIQFLTDTSLKVTGTQQIYFATIPAHGKIRDWKYTLSDALPTQLNVQTGTASQLLDVIGWSCP